MLELLLVMSVLMVALLATSQSLGASLQLNNSNRESALANDGLREQLEILQGVEDFASIFALYNADPGDDPVGTVAPGSGFSVAGLQPADDDPDGFVGEIVFPTVVGPGGLELHEDLDDPELGLPRDLDASGDVDGEDHADDYRLLPVTLRLRWRGQNGVRTRAVHTLLADR
jgi:hypothetical protein